MHHGDPFAAPTGTQLNPDGSPNWANHPPEVHCPMCDYNLFGLTEKRCPECGYQFEWHELLDAKRRPHPYLFEHHPESNFKSFWKTAWGGLQPWKFWKGIHPAMPSKPPRLLLYYLWTVALGFAMLLGHLTIASINLYPAVRAQRASVMMLPNYSVIIQREPDALDRYLPIFPSLGFFQWLLQTDKDLLRTVWLVSLVLLWPWLTFATLMIFRISMRRAKVRSIHVLRSIIYSYDAILFLVLPVVLLILIREFSHPKIGFLPRGVSPYSMSGTIQPFQPTIGFWDIIAGFRLDGASEFEIYGHCLVSVLVLVGSLKLAVAYRHYLKFDWPTATIFVTQFILAFALFILVVRTGMLR